MAVSASHSAVNCSAYLKFDFGTLGADVSSAEIERAVLWIYPSVIRVPGVIEVHAVTQTWDEESMRSAGFLTTAPGIETSFAVGLGQKKTHIPVDVTDLVKDWVDGVTVNNGLSLVPKFQAGFPNVNVGFDSKESTASSGHPFLEIILKSGVSGPSGIQGIPGPTGPTGQSYSPMAQGQGTSSNRQLFDAEAPGFTYLDFTTGTVYVRNGAAGNWITGFSLQGPAGLQGIAGPIGATGPQGLATRASATSTRLASLRWFHANTAIPSLSVGAANQPLGMACDGDYVWVALSGNDFIRKYRRDGTAITRPSGGSSTVAWGDASSGAPSYLVFTGDYVWVSRKTNHSVSLYNADGGGAAPFATISAATGNFDGPGHLCFDGTFVWVANEAGGTLTKIKALDRSVQGSATVVTPRGMAFDGTHLWVCSFDGNALVKIDPANGSVVGSVAVGSQPVEVVFDGTDLWVANSGSNNVTKIDTAGALIGTYAVENQPSSIVYDGRAIWVANAGSNTVSQLAIGTGALLGSYPSGGTTPSGLVFDGVNIWISNKGDGTVSRR